jgi:fatty-acyl-CoA synthase
VTSDQREAGGVLFDTLDRTLRRDPDGLAIVDRGIRLTWAEVDERSRQVARGLLARGVGRGDHVAVWLPNWSEWLLIWLGALRLGAVVVPVNTKFKAHEAGYVIRKSDAKVLFVPSSFLGIRYEELLREICPTWSVGADRPCTELPELRDLVVLGEPSELGMGYEEFLTAGDEVGSGAVDEASRQVVPDDAVAIVFTSGTTGFPKGVVHDHRVLRMMTAVSEWFSYSSDDRILGHLPLFHVAGLFSSFLPAMINGGAFVLMEQWDPTRALELIDSERVSVLSGIPTHFLDLLSHSELDSYDTSSLRIGWIGGATIPPEVIRGCSETLGMDGLLPIYGMTETTSTTAVGRVDDPLDVRLSGKGLPIGGYEVSVVDPSTGAHLRPGEEGEIVVRGYTVMRGYYRDPEATAAVFDDDGWFHTGDLGIFDRDGYLQITGRLKDMFIVGGNNVHPADVENVLLRMPGIRQAYVVARQDDRLGEVGVAFIERDSDDAPSREDVVAYCRAHLSSFKVPRDVVFMDSWPLTPTGKIQRFRLRELASEPAGPARVASRERAPG